MNRHGNDASKRQACGRLNRNPSKERCDTWHTDGDGGAAGP